MNEEIFIIYDQSNVPCERIKRFCSTLSLSNGALIGILVGQLADGNSNIVSDGENLSLIRNNTVVVYGAGVTNDLSCLRLSYMLKLIVPHHPSRIILWMPYFPFSRSDKLPSENKESISIFKECVEMINRATKPIPTSLITLDVYNPIIKHSFKRHIKVINCSFLPILYNYLTTVLNERKGNLRLTRNKGDTVEYPIKCVFTDSVIQKNFSELEFMFKPDQVLFASASKRLMDGSMVMSFDLPIYWADKTPGNWVIIGDSIKSGSTISTCQRTILQSFNSAEANLSFTAFVPHIFLQNNPLDGIEQIYSTDSTLLDLDNEMPDKFILNDAEKFCIKELQQEIGFKRR